MKPFESLLADKLEGFLSYRQSLGLKNRSVRSHLRRFDRYIMETNSGWDSFTPMFFLDYQGSIPGEGRTVNMIFSAVNGFFKFLVRREYVGENPLRDIPPRQENRYIPFIFAPKEVEQLLLVVHQKMRKTEDCFFHDYTIYMIMLLIARCGLRISEPLGLGLSSYRTGEKTIFIEKTKFYKDRLIPLPLRTARDMDNYLLLRHRFCKGSQYMFPGIRKKRMYSVFHQAVKDIGKNQQKQIIGTTTFGAPTVHSLRHSFAVNTLNGIKQRGMDPQRGLPVLSAYMGHRKYSYTALYLKMLDAKNRNNLVDFTVSHQEDL
jgi:site-specific recombinase XerD